MAHFKAKTLNGVTYDLSHLNPRTVALTHNGSDYRVLVEFGCHCFTEDTEDWHQPDRHYYHLGERRSFCTRRHDYSRRLPQIIANLPGKTVYFGNQLNYLVMRNTDLLGNGPPYLVFFKVEKMKRKKRGDVFMFVQSAYAKPNMIDRASPVSFSELIEATANGLPLVPGRSVIIKRE